MNAIIWFTLGILAALVATLPAMRLVLRRVEKRARDAERRARDAERLAELGSMTSGLAHEIKNPLSTIQLNAQLLGEAISDAEMPQENRERLLRRLESLSREAKRLGNILTDFLQFAGRVRLDPQPRDLRSIVEELTDFFHPQCDQARVVLRTQLPEQPVVVRVDEGLFKQALLNLMINATQAMSSDRPPGLGGLGASGSADDGAGHGHPSKSWVASGEGAASGGCKSLRELILRVEDDAKEARVHVTDTGPGILPERLEGIFRPYVSHKIGGTGLGLPTSRRIIQEHGGRLTAHSEPGRGSDFVIHLPREGAAVEAENNL